MESILAVVIGLIAALVLYRYLRQRNATPQQRVAAMLRQYDGFAREGLSEREALLRILLSRSGWQKLPLDFLGELVSRLGSKEAALRFVSLAEDCGYTKDQLPAIVNALAGGRSDGAVGLCAVSLRLSAAIGSPVQGGGVRPEARLGARS